MILHQSVWGRTSSVGRLTDQSNDGQVCVVDEGVNMEKLAFATLRETLRNYRHRKIKASGPPLFPLLAKERMKGWSVLSKEGKNISVRSRIKLLTKMSDEPKL